MLFTCTNASTTFVDSANSGSVTINTNTGIITRILNNDLQTEGSETIVIQLRTGSLTGSVVASASTVIINDTST